MSASSAELLARLPESQRRAILKDLTDREAEALEYDWRFWGRPEQIAPEGDWSVWLAMAGRGFGKTEAGAQWVRERVIAGARSIALVAETQKDLEEVMVQRLIKISPPKERPKVRYKPVRMEWPSGALALGYNGTEPDQLRGPQFDTAWVDELAKYRYASETWDMLELTMREGDPRVFVTTTPRPIPIIRHLLADAGTVVTRGSTYENAANLPQKFLERIRERYEGTRLGRQELFAELLDDNPGALWTRAVIDATRVKEAPPMKRVVVAVDPSGTKGGGEGDDIGIVIAGKGLDGRGYVLADWTLQASPATWGRRAVEAFGHFKADRIVAERNFGGAMVESVIKTADRNVPVKMVTASRGKIARAEPIAALYEQQRVSHVGAFAQLEDQMVCFTADGYVGDRSPDRADALVWALSELMLGSAEPTIHLGVY